MNRGIGRCSKILTLALEIAIHRKGINLYALYMAIWQKHHLIFSPFYNFRKENPDRHLKDIYQALAKAQVQVLATQLAENPDDMGNTMTAFGDTMTSQSQRPSSGLSGLGTTMGSEFGYN